MTIYRSKADKFAYFLATVGSVGFLICWIIGWTAEETVLGDPQFAHPTEQRPARIEMKGESFFVERDYAVRYRLADNLIVVFWTMFAAAAVVQNRRRIAGWWKGRRMNK